MDALEDDEVEIPLTALMQLAQTLRVQLQYSITVVDRMIIALQIAEANEDNERGDEARARIAGYLEQLAAIGAPS